MQTCCMGLRNVEVTIVTFIIATIIQKHQTLQCSRSAEESTLNNRTLGFFSYTSGCLKTYGVNPSDTGSVNEICTCILLTEE